MVSLSQLSRISLSSASARQLDDRILFPYVTAVYPFLQETLS
jgi:hypothetical protein